MKILNYILLFIFVSIFAEQKLFSETNLGFFAGLSTPNNEINNVYNSEKINLNSIASGKLIREASSLGYHIGAKARFSLSDNFSFTGSAAWHKFTESNIDVIDPTSGDTLARLTTVQNIIPITAGINFYIINSAIGIYGTGELAYNYIYNSVDVQYEDIPISLEKSPTDNRVGFGLGAGIDLDLQLLTINLEAKYNISNLIGKESNEATKSYFTVSLGVFF
jgi:opacity protein-like surface antigen